MGRNLTYRLENLLWLFQKKFGLTQYKSIIVETSSICNVRCVWCWMHYFDKIDKGLMSLGNFKKFIDLNAKYLKKKEITILPFSRGEALLHPEFFEMLDYADKRDVSFGRLATNLNVHLDIKRLMESPLPAILVNIGGITSKVHQRVMRGGDFKLVKNNLKKMLRVNKCKPIYIKMNPTKHNLHQIQELPSFFEKLGGDPKNVIVGSTGFHQPALASKSEIKEFIKNVVSDEMRDYLRFHKNENGNIVAEKQNCFFLIPTIRWDGKVTICCHDQLGILNLGNAFRTPLEDILISDKYKIAEKMGKLRKFYFCDNCN